MVLGAEPSSPPDGPPAVCELGLLVGSDVVHSLPADDTHVDVMARAEVAHDSGVDGQTHQLLRFLHLGNGAAVTSCA